MTVQRVLATVGGSVLGALALAALSIPAKAPAAQAPTGHAFPGVATVGALFPAGTVIGSSSGQQAGHFCTASVVHSPGADLAVTAAHCMAGRSPSIVFAPGYHDGLAPYGTWVVTRIFTDTQWRSSADPADDVAFLELAPAADGARVETVTGAEQFATTASESRRVRVIGYPDGTGEPVTCENVTRSFSATQLEFDCGGYPDGTSGGPFLTDVDSPPGEGTVIGVIGGYEQGGDTDAVSYAAVFSPRVAALYELAEANS